MMLSNDPTSVETRRRELRRLLIGRQITYPVMAYGLLGLNPNHMTVEEQLLIGEDLRVLGYERKLRNRPYRSAHMMAWWWREACWPEDINGAAPYLGIALEPDPDLENWDE